MSRLQPSGDPDVSLLKHLQFEFVGRHGVHLPHRREQRQERRGGLAMPLMPITASLVPLADRALQSPTWGRAVFDEQDVRVQEGSAKQKTTNTKNITSMLRR